MAGVAKSPIRFSLIYNREKMSVLKSQIFHFLLLTKNGNEMKHTKVKLLIFLLKTMSYIARGGKVDSG